MELQELISKLRDLHAASDMLMALLFSTVETNGTQIEAFYSTQLLFAASSHIGQMMLKTPPPPPAVLLELLETYNKMVAEQIVRLGGEAL